MNAPLTNGATGPADNSIRINPAVAASLEIQRPPPADLFGEPLPVITPAADLIQILLDRGWLKSRIAGAIDVHPAQVGRVLSGQQTASAETHRRLLALVESGALPDTALPHNEPGAPLPDPVQRQPPDISVTHDKDEPAISPRLLLMTNIPPAMREARRWLLHVNKIPHYADGARRQGQLDTPADWARLVGFAEMLAALDTGRYTGPGFALGPDGTGHCWQGIDLDHVDERPELAELGETLPGYVEISPSGTGLHAIGYGAAFKSLGSNQTGIEAYASGRYFTVTGQSVNDQGDIEDLSDFVESTLKPLHSPARQAPAPAPRQTAPGESFHAKVNAKALQTLSAWVPALLPKARPYHDGFRVSSADLGRNLEEDLSILPAGIKDFGEEAGKTPIDLVLDWGPAKDATEAALWLCSQIGIDPAALGWRGNPAKREKAEQRVQSEPRGAQDDPQNYDAYFQAGAESIPEPKTYPVPTALPKLPPVPELPLDILPNDLRGWIEDAAERARFRPDFAAVAAMSALGSVIGRQIGIRLKQKDDWTEHGNVWGCIVGPPSALKSPAVQQALKPFKWLQVAADERHKKAMTDFEEEMEIVKQRKEASKKRATKELAKNPDAKIDRDSTPLPEKPAERTYWTSNATAEALGVKLAENPTGLFLERDELSSLLVELEDERNATARGLYLSGWSGREGYRFDRIMRGTTTLPKFALSVFGGIQPGPLARYVRGAYSGERADGLLQRFQLAVWPDPATFEYVDRFPSATARDRARDLFDRADCLDVHSMGETDRFNDDPPYVRLSPAAQEIFIEWYTDFMRTRRQIEADGSESEPIGAHFGKFPGLVGKLSLILHVADDPHAQKVSETTIIKALAWLDYLTPHARRIYHAVEHPELGAASLLLSRLKRGELPPQFKPRDIYRKGWHGLSDPESVRRACELLREYDWLIDVTPDAKGNGRPADPVFSVSPAVEGLPE